MNKYYKLGVLFFLPLGIWGQGDLINNGASINVASGTTLRVEGGVENINKGVIDSEGVIYLSENWTQSGTNTIYTGNGEICFEGNTDQMLENTEVLTVSKLTVNSGRQLILQNAVHISSQINLASNGNIELGNNNLILQSGATILNYDPSNYIITNGTGQLQQEVSGSKVFFPIGNSSYNPITLVNDGVTDNFSVRIEDQVRASYPSGNMERDGAVGRTWFVEEETLGGSDVTMSLQWNTSDEMGRFDRAACGISHWTGNAWDRPALWVSAINLGGNYWEQTRSGITSFSPFAVEDLQQSLPITLLEFEAERTSNQQVMLNWSTATELNNRGFEIERMLESESNFTPIAWVNGAGTSYSTQFYEAMDLNSFSGLSYYRLKQINTDNTFTYTPIRSVEGYPIEKAFLVYPNPIEDNIHIYFSDLSIQNARIELFSIDGCLLISKTKTPLMNQGFTVQHLEHLPAGVYLLKLTTDSGVVFTERVIKKTP